jgi:hypothetical protein
MATKGRGRAATTKASPSSRAEAQYIVNGVSEEMQIVRGENRAVHSLTLIPDPEAEDYANGTVIKIGWFGPLPFKLNQHVTLVVEA